MGKEGNLVNSVRKCIDLYTGSSKQETHATKEKTVELVNLLEDQITHRCCARRELGEISYDLLTLFSASHS